MAGPAAMDWPRGGRRGEGSRGLDNPLRATFTALADRRRAEDASPRPLEPALRLEGRRYLVTGASSGLGRALAEDLLGRGAVVDLAVRGDAAARVAEIVAGVEAALVPGAAVGRGVDLADLGSVEALAGALVAEGVCYDGVVANAGLMARSTRATVQGFEVMFGVNYLAHYWLVRRLVEAGRLRTSASDRRPRVVVVSSEAHRAGAPLDLATLGELPSYGTLDGMRWYGRSKLALSSFARTLARRRPELAVHALCPGAVASNMAREAPVLIRPLLEAVMRRGFAPPEVAAQPVMHLLAAPEIEGETGIYLHVWRARAPRAEADDPALGDALWDRSEAMVRMALRGRLQG